MQAAVTRLIVLRGNSGSGKSSTAREIRERFGRGIAWIEQDYLRRVVLRERDTPGAVNIGLIAQNVRYSLDHGYHVILEGILDAKRYGDTLLSLRHDYAGRASFYYFDISLDETIRRHATRPQSVTFGPDEMEESTLDQTVTRIMTRTGLFRDKSRQSG